jgi:CubicO group peptidase (beta-lactamase class C family)
MVNTRSPLRLLAFATFFAQHLPLSQAQACPPFTPNLPISRPLAGTAAIAATIQNITGLIDAVLAEGLISDNDTSFSVDIYSLHDGGSLFTYHYSAPNLQHATEGVTSVDSNSIYRIGSISKVFTVYTYLASSGDISWNEPVTKYVPELAKAASSTKDDSDLDAVRWDDITLGSLASHLAGVIRDVQGNIPSSLAVLGLPPVPETNGSYCGSIPQFQFPCDRACKS